MVDDGRTDDRRTPDHGHPISSPCEPNGSGELKTKNSSVAHVIGKKKNLSMITVKSDVTHIINWI